MFCSMIHSFIEKINEKNGVPSISSAWENIVENECIAGYNLAIDIYN